MGEGWPVTWECNTNLLDAFTLGSKRGGIMSTMRNRILAAIRDYKCEHITDLSGSGMMLEDALSFTTSRAVPTQAAHELEMLADAIAERLGLGVCGVCGSEDTVPSCAECGSQIFLEPGVEFATPKPSGIVYRNTASSPGGDGTTEDEE
jgi:hypothetical protein